MNTILLANLTAHLTNEELPQRAILRRVLIDVWNGVDEYLLLLVCDEVDEVDSVVLETGHEEAVGKDPEFGEIADFDDGGLVDVLGVHVLD